MTCKAVRQFDEMFCAACGLRWAPQFDASPCATENDGPPTGDPRVVRFAKAIVGPHSDAHIGRDTMLRLRDHKWKVMALDSERKHALEIARAIIVEIDCGD